MIIQELQGQWVHEQYLCAGEDSARVTFVWTRNSTMDTQIKLKTYDTVTTKINYS